jgi:hypothetical protein
MHTFKKMSRTFFCEGEFGKKCDPCTMAFD